MKRLEDFPNPTQYARYLMKLHKTPKWMKEATVARRIRDGETDIDKILAPPMSDKRKGEIATKNSPVNPFNPNYLSKKTV
jgi:hypothetical protein